MGGEDITEIRAIKYVLESRKHTDPDWRTPIARNESDCWIYVSKPNSWDSPVTGGSRRG